MLRKIFEGPVRGTNSERLSGFFSLFGFLVEWEGDSLGSASAPFTYLSLAASANPQLSGTRTRIFGKWGHLQGTREQDGGESSILHPGPQSWEAFPSKFFRDCPRAFRYSRKKSCVRGTRLPLHDYVRTVHSLAWHVS